MESHREHSPEQLDQAHRAAHGTRGRARVPLRSWEPMRNARSPTMAWIAPRARSNGPLATMPATSLSIARAPQSVGRHGKWQTHVRSSALVQEDLQLEFDLVGGAVGLGG